MPNRTALRGARSRLAAATVAVAGACGGFAGTTTAVAAPVLHPQERALCQQINAFRAANGRAALRVSTPLTRAAKWMSRDMAVHDTFDHIDSRGRDFDRRVAAFGYRGMTKAENLAAGESEASAAFKQFKRSSSHRKGMLSARLKTVGIGRAHRADSMFGWYWSTTFGAGRDRGVAC